METEDLIQFSSSNNNNKTANNNEDAKQQPKKTVNNNNMKNTEDEDSGLGKVEELGEEEDDEEDMEYDSARTADEQIDYLESLEPCPCYAKCCIDSVITLFCVTLLG